MSKEQVVVALGGEDRCRVRRRVYRWSREGGSILELDSLGGASRKLYTRKWDQDGFGVRSTSVVVWPLHLRFDGGIQSVVVGALF